MKPAAAWWRSWIAGNGAVSIVGLDNFWEDGAAPPWAVDWDEDEYGPWVVFEVTGANGETVQTASALVPARGVPDGLT